MYEFKHPRKTLLCEDTAATTDLAKLNEDQLYTWLERVAICVIHGGLSEEEAQAIAWQQVRRAEQV